jgi:hypothetical protein
MRAFTLLSDYSSLAYPATIATVTGAITVTTVTGAVTGTTHKLVLGDTVIFDAANTPAGQTNAAPPAPLVAGVEYWAVPTSATSFGLATTFANAVAGIVIATTGGTVTTAAYTVNHYILFANDAVPGGLTPYIALEDSQILDILFQPSTSVPVVNYTGVTGTSASPGVFTLPVGATLANGRAVKLGGNVPAGLKKNTVYYVVATSTNTFELAATPGGAAINTTSATTSALPTTVYDVTGMNLGGPEASGEIGAVGSAADFPFAEGDNTILALQASFLALNFTTFYIEGANDAVGAPDVPGTAWTVLGSATQTGVGTLPEQLLNITLPQYIRVRVNVLTDFGGGGSGGGLGIVATASASLLGN